MTKFKSVNDNYFMARKDFAMLTTTNSWTDCVKLVTHKLPMHFHTLVELFFSYSASHRAQTWPRNLLRKIKKVCRCKMKKLAGKLNDWNRASNCYTMVKCDLVTGSLDRLNSTILHYQFLGDHSRILHRPDTCMPNRLISICTNIHMHLSKIMTSLMLCAP